MRFDAHLDKAPKSLELIQHTLDDIISVTRDGFRSLINSRLSNEGSDMSQSYLETAIGDAYESMQSRAL